MRQRDLLLRFLRARLADERCMLPEGAEPLWSAFCALSERRTWHAAGPNPIPYQEIEAWARLMRWPLEPHHVEIICALDAAWIDDWLGRTGKRESDGKRLPARSGQAISPDVFDAVFG